MRPDNGSMRWYGYLALPLTLTAGAVIYCAYQAVWYGLGLVARVEKTFKEHARSRLSHLETY